MTNEIRAAEAYRAKMDHTAIQAAFTSRMETMRANAHTWDGLLTTFDGQLTELLADATGQGLPVVPAGLVKDYRVFTRQIVRVYFAHPFNILGREFGGFVALWASRGLYYPWLRRIGSVIFSIPEDIMDHALLSHLAYADAGHSGFAPSPAGTPTASAPGDTGAAGTAAEPPHADHRHARESFGTSAGSVCQGNDARLSDARTPAAHGNSLHSFYGNSFPAPSVPNDIYFHTTFNDWFYFNGANWVSCRLYSRTLNAGKVQPNNDNGSQGAAPKQPAAQNMLIEFVDWLFRSDTTQSGTKYVTYALTMQPSATVLASFDSQNATSANTWYGARTNVSANTGTSDIGIDLVATRSSSPGNITISAVVLYRIIGG